MYFGFRKDECRPFFILDRILEIKEPPVARCRLLSGGMKPYNRLHLEQESVTGDKACLGCGNCLDFCPVIIREPGRFDRTMQRTSMALESVVGDDCEQCSACIIACPQVDFNIKNYILSKAVKGDFLNFINNLQSLIEKE